MNGWTALQWKVTIHNNNNMQFFWWYFLPLFLGEIQLHLFVQCEFISNENTLLVTCPNFAQSRTKGAKPFVIPMPVNNLIDTAVESARTFALFLANSPSGPVKFDNLVISSFLYQSLPLRTRTAGLYSQFSESSSNRLEFPYYLGVNFSLGVFHQLALDTSSIVGNQIADDCCIRGDLLFSNPPCNLIVGSCVFSCIEFCA